MKQKKSQTLAERIIKEIDVVTPSAKQSRHEELLYAFEDNDAVVNIIIKARSPTNRHVSRTHRVPLGWLFYRINLDPMIQVKFVDTGSQLRGIFHS